MKKINSIKIILVVLICLSATIGSAQYLIEVRVTGGYSGINCNGSAGVTGVLKDASGTVLNSATQNGPNSFQKTSFFYSASGPLPLKFKIAGSGFANCSGQPNGSTTMSDQAFELNEGNVPATCGNLASFDSESTNYVLTVTLNVTNLTMATPELTVAPGCAGVVTLTIDDPSGSFDWTVSEDGIHFATFRSNAGNVINATINELTPYGFSKSKFTSRSIRVVATTCSKRRVSGVLTDVKFNALPPTATITSTPPTCYGGSNGVFQINIRPSTPEVNDFYLKVFNPGNSSDFPDHVADIQNTTDVIFNSLKVGNQGQGTFKVTIQNNSGEDYGDCQVTYFENLDNPSPFTISHLSSNPVSCHTSDVSSPSRKSDGSVTLNVANGNSSFTYQYATYDGSGYSGYNTISPNSSSSLTPILSNLPKGVYKFKAIDSKSCGSNELSNISVNGPPSPVTVTELNKIDVVCRDNAQGGIDILASGGNGGFAFAWSGPDGYSFSGEDISRVYSGVYNLTVTDVKGCVNNSYSSTITQPATKLAIVPLKSLYGFYNTSCLIYDGTIDLSYQNRTYAIANYEWRKNGSPLLPLPTSGEHLNGLGPGFYDVKVTDVKGCEAATTIEMSENPGITISTLATSDYNGYNTKCNSPTSQEGMGKVIVTNSFGSLNYVWDHDPDLNNSVVSDLAPGTYHISVTDGNHCVDDDNLVIIPPPSIQPHLQITSNYNGPAVSCPGSSDGRIESFPINGFGSYHYSWQHNPNLTSKFSNGLSSGTYTITVKDDYGCSSNESVTLIDPPSMKFLFEKKNYNGSDLSCYGKKDGAIALTVLNGLGPPSSFLYNWSNNASTKDVSSLSQGDYRVSVSDANRCVKDSTVSIVAPSELSISIQHGNDFNGFDVRCHGEVSGELTALPKGGTGDYSYLWSNGKTTSKNIGLGVGYYSVTVTDINGCKQARSVSVLQPTPLTASLNLDQPVSCSGFADGKVTLNGSGGVTPYEYSMDRSTWVTSNVFLDLPARVNKFFIRDGNGCGISLTETISEPLPLQLTFVDKVDAECNDPVGSVRAVITGGNGGYRYSWVSEEMQRPKNNGDVLSNAVAGIYRVDVLDSKKCTISDRIEISSVGGAQFEITDVDPTKCFGSADGSAAIRVASGVEPFIYEWSEGQTTARVNNLSQGKHFATVTDALDCKTIKQVTIASPEQVRASYVKQLPLCVKNCDGRIAAIVSGGIPPYNYEWNNKSSSSNEVTNLCAGNYELRVNDANYCSFIEKIVLADPEPLFVNARITSPSCLGQCDGAIIVSGAGGAGSYQFDWHEDGATSTLIDRCSGIVQVTMKDANNCRVEQSFVIPDGKPISIDFGTTATLCVGQSKILDAGSQWISSSWTSDAGFASTESKISIKDPGIYFFRGIDKKNCVALDTFKLETSSDLLKAEFLMPAQAMVGDTLVAIDISWPIPEKVEWNYPTSFKVVASPADEMLYAQPSEAGTFTLGMKSFLAECQDMREKTITVLATDDERSQGRLGHQELIKEFTLSPNPNDGRFSVNVELTEEAWSRTRIIQYPSGRVLAENVQAPSMNHETAFDLHDLPQGLYVVLLEVKNQQRFVRFFKE